MNRTPPAEFAQIGLNAASFKAVGSNEWHGECPFCGGHDRFAVFTNREYPHWNCWCRVCHPESMWIDAINPALRQAMTEEYRQKMDAERQADEARRKAELDTKLAGYSAAEIWAAYNRRLTTEHRNWWANQGVPAEWQDYLSLGYTPDKSYYDKTGELQHSPAYTIPYFHFTQSQSPTFRTIQYRLFNPDNPADRYRFEHGLGTSFYETVPTEPVKQRAVILEGAKKAMVIRIWAYEDDDNTTVLGIPSKVDFGGVVESVKDCDRVWIALDPDATSQAYKLAREVGPAARVIEMPVKPDDAFVLHGATASDWERAVKYAVKI